MYKVRLTSIVLLFLSQAIFALNRSDSSKVTLIFAGDIMGHDAQIESAFDPATGKYNYLDVFAPVKSLIEEADIAVANLEVTLAGPPYKGYPQFSSPDELAEAARDAGFDVLLTANNHSLDRGKRGLERTLDVLDKLEITCTGTFRNAEERLDKYPLFIEKNGFRLAILNYTYGTNGLKVEAPNIVNYIDTETIKKDLLNALVGGSDYTIVTIHWGKEYQLEASAGQKSLAKIIFDNGADLIIGSHPHVVQPVDIYYPEDLDSADYKIVAYSLGNYVSNQRARTKDGGIMFRISLEKTDRVRIADYHYIPTWVRRSPEPMKFEILPAGAALIDPGNYNLAEWEINKLRLFYEDTKKQMSNLPEFTVIQGLKVHKGKN